MCYYSYSNGKMAYKLLVDVLCVFVFSVFAVQNSTGAL